MSAIGLPPQKTSSPELVSCSRSRLSKGWQLRKLSRQHDSSASTYCPSALSSSFTPGTTRDARTSPHCLAGNIAQKQHRLPPIPLSAFYSGHTPPLRRLNHVADQATHRLPTGYRSGSCVSHHLRLADHVAIPCDREELQPCVQLFRVGTVAEPMVRFRGIERGSVPLPIG